MCVFVIILLFGFSFLGILLFFFICQNHIVVESLYLEYFLDFSFLGSVTESLYLDYCVGRGMVFAEEDEDQ